MTSLNQLSLSVCDIAIVSHLVQLGSIEFVECALGDDNYLETFAVLECMEMNYCT